MLPIVIAVVIALLLKSFVFANAVVPTGSMISTINEGDRIIASRVAYINKEPQRYDIKPQKNNKIACPILMILKIGSPKIINI